VWLSTEVRNDDLRVIVDETLNLGEAGEEGSTVVSHKCGQASRGRSVKSRVGILRV